MRKYLIASLVGTSLLVSGFSVNAAGLSDAQIQAIMGLLSTFNVDASIVQNVEVSLRGGTPNPTTPPVGEACPAIARICKDGSTAKSGPKCSHICPEDKTTVRSLPAVCPMILRQLKQGISGSDVMELQKFLSEDSSVGFSAGATGYFGPATLQALQKWQAKEGVVTSGSPETTGYGALGPRTREAIARKCANLVNPIKPEPGNDFFKASPTSGIAPLTVIFMPNVKLEGPNTVDGGAYKIVFGDGREQRLTCPLNSTANSCKSLPVTHTYSANGTYTASLVSYGGFLPAGTDNSKTLGTVTVKVQ